MLSRLLTGICATAGSLAGAQFPNVYAQYLQQISGRLTQVLRDLAPVLQAAQARGVSVEAYLRRAAAETTAYTEASVQGDLRAVADMQVLEVTYSALSGAEPALRAVVFVRHLDWATLEAVLADYTPGVPLTQAGLIHAGAGLLIGLSAAWVLESPLRVWHDRRRRKRRARQSARPQARAVKGARPGKANAGSPAGTPEDIEPTETT